MRFSQDIDTSQHFVRGYGPGWIKINEQEIRRSMIVTPEQLITDWPPQTFADLEERISRRSPDWNPRSWCWEPATASGFRTHA